MALDVKILQQGIDGTSKDLQDLIPFFAPQLHSHGLDATALSARAKSDCWAIATFRVAKIGEAKNWFPDVPAGHWSNGAVQYLRANGVLHGYENGRFGG